MRTRSFLSLAFAVLLVPLAVGCSCDDGEDPDGGVVDGGGPGADGGDGMDAGVGNDGGGAGADGGGTGSDAEVVFLDGGGILLPDGNILPPGPIPCQGHIYLCGDNMDNDDDGLADDRDPDCLGPCDNNEGGFDLMIPGGGAAPCKKDCYFDQDTGSGNDTCAWDHRCDPEEPSLAGEGCEYSDPPPPAADCPAEQEDTCAEICSPLVPNGCDCFGCCQLPAGADGALEWVYIGTLDADEQPTCRLDNLAGCNPCTPVGNCLNECGECEICLGRPELPEECFPPPPPPDAGFFPDGGPRPTPDAGPRPDGGTPPPICEDGRQPCGFTGAEPCDVGFFCLTGCCTFFG